MIVASSKKQVKVFFSERVQEWENSYADTRVGARTLLSRQRLALAMVEAAVPRPAKILDAGCGTGETAVALMLRGHEVWGVDIAEPMVHRARERCGSDRVRIGDIEQLPFEDDAFDAVVCLGVMEYLDSDEQSLREIRRVLKPGGAAVITTPNACCPLQQLDQLLTRLADSGRALRDVVRCQSRGKPAAPQPATPAVQHRTYHRRRWFRLLRSEGLEPQEWVCHGFGWYRSRFEPVMTRLARRAELDRLARNRAFNWLLAEHLVCVRAVKPAGT